MLAGPAQAFKTQVAVVEGSKRTARLDDVAGACQRASDIAVEGRRKHATDLALEGSIAADAVFAGSEGEEQRKQQDDSGSQLAPEIARPEKVCRLLVPGRTQATAQRNLVGCLEFEDARDEGDQRLTQLGFLRLETLLDRSFETDSAAEPVAAKKRNRQNRTAGMFARKGCMVPQGQGFGVRSGGMAQRGTLVDGFVRRRFNGPHQAHLSVELGRMRHRH